MSAKVSQIETRSMLRKRSAVEVSAPHDAKVDDVLPSPPPPPAKRAVPVTCLLCDERDAEIATSRCQHLNLCVRCFYESDRWRRSPNNCDRCGVQVWNYDGRGGAATIERVVAMRCFAALGGDDVHAHLSQVLRLARAAHVGNADALIKSLCDALLEHATDGDDDGRRYPLLTVDACERLLVECDHLGLNEIQNGDKLHNVLVSFCREPWNVDAKVGSHGVCYHGNMGSAPTVLEAVRCIERNLRYITGKDAYF